MRTSVLGGALNRSVYICNMKRGNIGHQLRSNEQDTLLKVSRFRCYPWQKRERRGKGAQYAGARQTQAT
jgi:hypothetical protein